MKIELQTRADSALRCPGCHDDLEAAPPAAEEATPASPPWRERALPWLSLGISLAALGASWAPSKAPAQPRPHHCCSPTQRTRWTRQPLPARDTNLTLEEGQVIFYEPAVRGQAIGR